MIKSRLVILFDNVHLNPFNFLLQIFAFPNLSFIQNLYWEFVASGMLYIVFIGSMSRTETFFFRKRVNNKIMVGVHTYFVIPLAVFF